MACVFCKIAKGEMPADTTYKDNEILGFKSIEPDAPLHLVFIPKRHLEWKDEFGKEELNLLSKLIFAAKKTAIKEKIDYAYKLIFNVGRTGHVPHVHLHLLGGWKRKIPMHNI